MPRFLWLTVGRARGAADRIEPALNGTDTGGDFTGAEGLGNVIVRAQFQAENAVDLLTSGRQKKDRDATLLA